MENLKPVGKICGTIGALPTSYLISLTYEEQLVYLCKKMDEMIKFINDDITSEIKEYINQEFNNIMMDTMYDPLTETLTLYLRNNNGA